MYVHNVATHASNVAANVSTNVGNIEQLKFQSHLHPIHGDLPVSLPLENKVFMKSHSFKVVKFLTFNLPVSLPLKKASFNATSFTMYSKMANIAQLEV